MITSMTTVVNAQTLWVNGVIFSESGDKLIGVPYATVLYCDYDDHNKIEYVGFTDHTGSYDIGKDVVSKKYFVKIISPGYREFSKTFTKLPKSHSGNLTLHFKLEKNEEVQFNVKKYSTDALSTKAGTIAEAIASISDIDLDKETFNITTSEGGSIRIFINGVSLPIKNLPKLAKIPAIAIENIDFILFDNSISPIFSGVINIELKDSQKASGILSFEPYVANQFD